MKVLILALVSLMSLAAFSDSDKERKGERKEDKKEDKKEWRGHPKPLSAFDVIPLNSPVKESVAKFLLQVPDRFDIDEVRYRVRNASRLFDKDRPHQKINLIEGPPGKELHISVSKLPPGFYQLFVKVRDRKNNEHDYKSKFKDHAMFVVDSSLQVPMPDPKLNDKTIAGVDSDGDGIRDDVQRWINEKYADKPRTKMAIKQLAMSKQLDLISVSDKAQSIIAGRKMLKDLSCLSYVVGVDEKIKISDMLNSKMLNTKDRHYAEIKSNSNFSGQSFSVPYKEEEKKARCEFNPDNL